jgi:hypothetical protein
MLPLILVVVVVLAVVLAVLQKQLILYFYLRDVVTTSVLFSSLIQHPRRFELCTRIATIERFGYFRPMGNRKQNGTTQEPALLRGASRGATIIAVTTCWGSSRNAPSELLKSQPIPLPNPATQQNFDIWRFRERIQHYYHHYYCHILLELLLVSYYKLKTEDSNYGNSLVVILLNIDNGENCHLLRNCY